MAFLDATLLVLAISIPLGLTFTVSMLLGSDNNHEGEYTPRVGIH